MLMRPFPHGKKDKQTKKIRRNELEGTWSVGDASPSSYPPRQISLLYHVSPQWKSGSLDVNDVERFPICH